MKPARTPNQIRANIAHEAAAQGQPLYTLSRVINRSDSYMQRYVREGKPDTLPEADRARLARFLGVDGSDFGAVAQHAAGRAGGRR